MILDKETIDKIFKKPKHQNDAVLGLYKTVIPDFDVVEKVQGYPRANPELNKYIFSKFMEFDRKQHPGVMPGGAWMNWGFSSDGNLNEWEVIVDKEILIYPQ